MIVCKFGGSSVASAKQLEKVKAIINSNTERQIVVVSAPGKRDSSDTKVTDLLYTCCKEVKEVGNCEASFSKIETRFLEIMKDFELDTSKMEEALKDIKAEINLNADENFAASRGEYLNAILIAEYFDFEFVNAAKLITIDDNGYAADETWTKISNVIEDGKKYIIPGFYGVNKDGVITTFSRGGSDITGAILAKAVKASVYENWTDVAGCYNADPRYIKKAYPIETMTYSEVRELSAFGASVFHADAIAPVMEEGIAINIKNTNDPEAKGTFIVASKNNDGAIGVSKESNFIKLFAKKLMLFKDLDVKNKMQSIFKSNGVVAHFEAQGVDSYTCLFKAIDKDVIENIKQQFISILNMDEVIITDSLALVGVVGQNIDSDINNTKKCIEALSENEINVYQSVIGASSLSIYFVVDEYNAKKSVEVIFDKIF